MQFAKLIIVLSLMGFSIQTLAEDHTDAGFAAFNFNIIPEKKFTKVKGFALGISYGGPLSKKKNQGFYEIGLRNLHDLFGLQFKYSYPFYFGRISVGPDVSLVIGSHTKHNMKGPNEEEEKSNLSLGGEAGLFASGQVSKMVSVLVHLGSNYLLILKDPGFKSENLDFHFGLSVRWHLL